MSCLVCKKYLTCVLLTFWLTGYRRSSLKVYTQAQKNHIRCPTKNCPRTIDVLGIHYRHTGKEFMYHPTVCVELTHVDITAKRATTSLNFLKRNLNNYPSTVNERCYKSLVRPIMVYASSFWDPHTKQNIQTQVMIQRIAARFVKDEYSTISSVAAMLADLQWNTLHQRRVQSKTVTLYRVVHQLISIPITPFLIPARVFGGHTMKFAIPQSSVNLHLYSFFPSDIRIWNQFPQQSQHQAWRPSEPASIHLLEHVDQHPNLNLYMNCL